MFSCVDIDENLSHLSADLEIECWTATHTTYTFAIALPILLIWGLFNFLHIFILKRNWNPNVFDLHSLEREKEN